MMLALRAAVSLLVCFGISALAASAAPCAIPAGGRVMLAADAAEPDVFLWDSRTRLVEYVAGHWDSTRAIFAHTELAEPGTQALVVSCVAGIAHPNYGPADEDAVGVKVVSGRHRGRYGWVLSSDIHVARPNGQSAILTAPKN
jgi:hypothetical protein